MGTEKRARQKANRASKVVEAETQAKVESREESTKRVGLIAAIVAGVIGLFLLISFLGGGDSTDSNEIVFTPTPVAESAEDAVIEVELADSVPDDFEPWAGQGALATVEPKARNGAYSEPPPMTIDPDRSYAAIISTDVGPIRLELLTTQAPETVNNFVSLARDGFYDGLTFHQVVAGSLAQSGDPTETGTGGPGYSFDGEIVPTLNFDQRGRFAMANPDSDSGSNAEGSQFFITFEPQPDLDGAHSIFGQLVGDDSVLDKIMLSTSGDPATVIESVRIVEG